MHSVVVFIVGVLIGCIVTQVVCRLLFRYSICKSLVGHLFVDASNPEDEPSLFLELSKDMDILMSKKEIMLKVNVQWVGYDKVDNPK